MSSAYNCELALRTIRLLAILPMGLRGRLPVAWDEGMRLINAYNLPESCMVARNALSTLRLELTRDSDSYFAKNFGAAYASVRRRHNHPTLAQFAELMLDVQADLDRQFELENQGKLT